MKKSESIAYKIGQVTAVIFAACLSVAAIALTIKFVMWLF